MNPIWLDFRLPTQPRASSSAAWLPFIYRIGRIPLETGRERSAAKEDAGVDDGKADTLWLGRFRVTAGETVSKDYFEPPRATGLSKHALRLSTTSVHWRNAVASLWAATREPAQVRIEPQGDR
jgi:hypothetical protein